VSFGSNGAGSFGASQCTLSGSGASASCSVTYTPSGTGSHTISAGYGGDATHAGGSATAAVAVQPTSNADYRHGGWQNLRLRRPRQCLQFVSGGLGEPPPSKANCRHGGWRDHRAARTTAWQFVATGGKNEPGKNVPTPKEP
jgi:hypothetical protein